MRQVTQFTESGIASWYGKPFHGRKTSNGEIYDMYALSAAHPTLPLPIYAEVTNLENGKQVNVRINDRGPFKKNRVIDLSYGAAKKLGFVSKGTTKVSIRVISSGPKLQDSYIQAGAFSQLDNAKRLKKRIGNIPHTQIKLVQTQAAGKTIYKLHIGPVKDAQHAKGIHDHLQALRIPFLFVSDQAALP